MPTPKSDRLRLACADAGLEIDLARGVLTDLWFGSVGRVIRPLHRAHWVGQAVPDGLAPVEAGLEGDFLSAPFGRDDLEPGEPIHGPSANTAWRVVAVSEAPGAAEAVLELVAPVRGARIFKHLQLVGGVPFLRQTHRIEGGSGSLTLAHHPMIRFAGRGWLSFSAKRAALTGLHVEPGRHRLVPGGRSEDLGALPGMAGPVSLFEYPQGDWAACGNHAEPMHMSYVNENSRELGPAAPLGHEDFLTLVEAAGNGLGWTAALREAEDDLVLALKDPAELPVTMLWLSNGGRDAAPWDGRHRGVLGIEDGITAGDEGNRAAAGVNRVAAEGAASCLALAPGRVHVVRHLLGAVPRPAGWVSVDAVRVAGERLVLTGAGGEVALAYAGPF
ncbi:hypothetical protein [Frigidibacter sp.]|uniref:hypothetical protein n=1 Tax=Frigidibacter sp. TaxID=2586418 RepID=UPI002732D8F7|nr:hypothetical protein [Frigidibacter sp.]MDP3342609.1 hypothetical protein [Frigidibacter sp.]